MGDDISKPYKICDVNRDKKKGVVASSLEDLLTKVPDKLGLPSDNLTVVLESDGTEVDDEEYFSTLDPDTSLMILHGTKKWVPNMPKFQVSLDHTDNVNLGDKSKAASLVGRLQHNLCHISLLGDQDLELLSDMDPDSLADIVTDRDNRIFLEHIKEASGRILLEKRQAQDAMELLKLYHQSAANGTEGVFSSGLSGLVIKQLPGVRRASRLGGHHKQQPVKNIISVYYNKKGLLKGEFKFIREMRCHNVDGTDAISILRPRI